MYNYKDQYTDNTIGCNNKLENYHGEMSAIYFAEITQNDIHKVLCSLKGVIDISDLTMVLSGNLSQWISNELLKTRLKNEVMFLLKKIFISVNPKFICGNIMVDEEVILDKQKTIYMIPNCIVRIYENTQILHNTLGIDIFMNIGGVKTLIPILEDLTHDKTNFDISYLYLF